MKSKFIIFISLGLICSCLQGCSYDDFNRGAYNSVQSNQRERCYRLIGHLRDDCLARLKPTYDQYKKQTENEPLKRKADNF